MQILNKGGQHYFTELKKLKQGYERNTRQDTGDIKTNDILM